MTHQGTQHHPNTTSNKPRWNGECPATPWSRKHIHEGHWDYLYMLSPSPEPHPLSVVIKIVLLTGNSNNNLHCLASSSIQPQPWRTIQRRNVHVMPWKHTHTHRNQHAWDHHQNPAIIQKINGDVRSKTILYQTLFRWKNTNKMKSTSVQWLPNLQSMIVYFSCIILSDWLFNF